MGPIAIQRLIRRSRRHLVGLLAVLALAGVVAMHHSEIGSGAMGAMHHDTGTTIAMTVCLGAFVALGAAVTAVAVGVLRLGRWPALSVLAPEPLRRAGAPRSLARAGPPGLPLLSVWRI